MGRGTVDAPDTGQRAGQTAAEHRRLSYRLERIPLGRRMIVYAAVFLSVMLVGLPWLAYRIDVYLPGWHVEIGWFRIPGLVLFGVFFVLYAYCSFVLTTRGKGAYVEFDPPTEFVATGPYRWMRNPVAACLVGMLLGEAIALSSTGVFLLFLGALLPAHLQVVLLEEPLLRKRFGQDYEDYLRRVPRWLPRPPERGSP
jgi:protein-S-isoprenylcysteine O-methyltransferase Ste14